MLVVAFFHWWYGPGWRDTAGRLRTRMRETLLTFSVPILLSTIFAPWKRIVTYSSGSLSDRFRAVVDNLVSRVVGFIVRLCALTAAISIVGFYLVFGTILLLIWPVLPVLGPILLVAGFIV